MKMLLLALVFVQDTRDGREEQCRWCRQVGTIVLCDTCDKGFCEVCIVRNFGRTKLTEILDNNHWSCFYCNPELLSGHVNELKEFRKSVPSGTNFAVRREDAAAPSARTKITVSREDVPTPSARKSIPRCDSSAQKWNYVDAFSENAI